MTRKSNRLRYREPNGRLQRERESAPAEIRRLRDAALSGMRDPLWGTELGRLHLEGKISEAELAAGKKWAELAAQFKQAIQSPSEFPEMANFDKTRGGSMDPDSDAGQKQAAHHRDIAERFRAAHSYLVQMGRTCESVVRAVCERNEVLAGYKHLYALSVGLSTLAMHWELTPPRKSANVR